MFYMQTTLGFWTLNFISGIYWFYWQSDTLKGPKMDPSSQTLLMNMSSNASAGPIAMDTARDRLIYVDRNPANRFIGEWWCYCFSLMLC